MRKINPKDFKLATRGTSRDINKQIALTLIGTHQPVSRAELSRLMDTNRANITFLVNELLEEKLVREGDLGERKTRGRKPTHLYLNSHRGIAVALDIRATKTYMMLTDSIGKQISGVAAFPTLLDPERFVRSVGENVRRYVDECALGLSIDGIGVVVPGILDRERGTVVHAPPLGWRNVDLLSPLEREFPEIEIHLENSGRACALSQIWRTHEGGIAHNDIVFVSVSDGVGVGVVVNGELIRGRNNTAGEFGHVPISVDGPRCSCGANGCWEAYISNPATLARYFGHSPNIREPRPVDVTEFTVEDLIIRARGNDSKALAAINSTARYLGIGLGSIINAVDPSRIYIGGEITAAWDLIEHNVREAIRERTLTSDPGKVSIGIVPVDEYPRLRGAAALVTAPAFAAPKVA